MNHHLLSTCIQRQTQLGQHASNIHVPCSNLRVVTEVARSLEFSDKVTELADRVIHGMTMAGKYEYNAVHLRIEKDARDWSQIMGGEEVQLLQAQVCDLMIFLWLLIPEELPHMGKIVCRTAWLFLSGSGELGGAWPVLSSQKSHALSRRSSSCTACACLSLLPECRQLRYACGDLLTVCACMTQVVWNGYVTSMLQAGFTSDLVLYAASGLLTYGANDGMHCCLPLIDFMNM